MTIKPVKDNQVVSWGAFALWLLNLLAGFVVDAVLFIEKWAIALSSIALFVVLYIITHGGVK